MPRFLELPVELLPAILLYIIRPSHLAAICLVNKSFHFFAVSQLYERAFIYAWHKEGKTKVVKLFQTLADHPHLAKHVQQLAPYLASYAGHGSGWEPSVGLEQHPHYPTSPAGSSRAIPAVIRDFPKALQSADHESVLGACLAGLAHCENLRACTWTRDGSLTSSVLEALLKCPRLEELEINGHHERNYDPRILVRFAHLRRISLIMPSGAVIDTLPAWVGRTGESLTYLSLICKSSPLVNDGLLERLAPHLTNLEHLYIVGCPKVTDQGLWAVVNANYKGLLSLGAEGVSVAFDMSHFSHRCENSRALARLTSLTFAVSAPGTNANPEASAVWEAQYLALLMLAPLEQFHISTIGGHVGLQLSDAFCTAVVDAHKERLRRFSVHRMRMSIGAIADICRRCTRLEQLFVVVEQHSLDALGPCLAEARCLRAVHVNRPLEIMSEGVSVVPRERILEIVRQGPSTITQFGFNTRVWQIERVTSISKDGAVDMDVRLSSYESPEVPEQFLVVRT